MANTFYDSDLTGEQIEGALEAIHGVVDPANNGKVLAISNGAIVARSVQWGGGAVLESLSVTANGDYAPGTGVDGFNSVHVAVPGGGSAVLQPLSVMQNGIYNPPSGIDGYSSVTVNVSGGGAVFADSAPATTTGAEDGDYYYQRFGQRLAYDRRTVSWKDASSTYSTGNKFTCNQAVKIVGLFAFSRRSNLDIYLSAADGTTLAHVTLSTAKSGGYNIVYLDAPVDLSANEDYVVWYSNNGPGSYIDNGSTAPADSRFTHVSAVYASGTNNFPTQSISQNLYPVDVVAIDENLDACVVRQWILKSGVWTQINSL